MKINKNTLIISLIFFVILYTVFKIFRGTVASNSFLVGWLVSMGNYLGLARKIESSFSSMHFRTVVFSSQVRFVLTAAVMIFWFKYARVDILGLLVGLTTVAVCVPLGYFLAVRRNISWNTRLIFFLFYHMRCS